jgi:hypothetical protein
MQHLVALDIAITEVSENNIQTKIEKYYTLMEWRWSGDSAVSIATGFRLDDG